MTSSTSLPEIDRRSLLRSAILLVGGSLAGGLPASAVASQLTGDSGKSFFSPAELAILAEVAEVIIPRTDTPGAKDAGVAQALDALMADWASPIRKMEFRALVQQFGAAGVLSAAPSERLGIVSRIDAAGFAANDPVYRKFKELVLILYYWSEPGATEELRYELVPGAWEPAIAIDSDTRTWAA